MSSTEFKEKGNEAFAAKKYDEAIELYTKAIQLDSKSHVFFSNRSASYAGLQKWEEAVQDAKQCIKLNPSFIKGYYRLATSQIELNQLDGATSTIKQGLNIDPVNTQLARLLRSVKAKKASQKSTNTVSAPSSTAAINAATTNDSSINKELVDLQTQFSESMRDLNVVNANINSTQKSLKVNEITLSELHKLPNTTNTDSSSSGANNANSESSSSSHKMYRGIGKMFMLTNQNDVHNLLEEEMKEDEKKVNDLMMKKDYLERRLKSQQQNIMELTKSGGASYATSSA